MRYSTFFASALLASSLLAATASQAAPVLDSLRVIPPVQELNLPEPPAAPVLDLLVGNEFSPIQLALPDLTLDRGPITRPSKPRFQVPEPNGLFLLSLGVFSMGVLRLRTKNQTL
ncbi:MAG TPA: PEP-CTERM sorting domain-containing protein [Cellvibrionaceae bacterium]|nr:PEP-CTERM sorting domain-containing protein [Cellvibrionaceae bacterium]HMW48233.1 PEP-CTERM sorting domain-containing protein [Cellvibrionaceae bacterium]HMW70320.1 PEP-CTERM sorting domain-containing protein [Cellvibrionaceae bacterium]HMY38737.1 PEP-CTERM sorting domain-containing protein [Marinagarivorans sp.]HNG58747.1 PEP-CTERM sorting domain-containing protein [Cellvibrionaceae bacterium]